MRLGLRCDSARRYHLNNTMCASYAMGVTNENFLRIKLGVDNSYGIAKAIVKDLEGKEA